MVFLLQNKLLFLKVIQCSDKCLGKIFLLKLGISSLKMDSKCLADAKVANIRLKHTFLREQQMKFTNMFQTSLLMDIRLCNVK